MKNVKVGTKKMVLEIENKKTVKNLTEIIMNNQYGFDIFITANNGKSLSHITFYRKITVIN